jgi:hypothetical protein
MGRPRRGFVVPALVAGLLLLLSAPALKAQEHDAPASRPSPAMQRLAGAIGSWTLELESRNGPHDPFTRLETTSAITEILSGAFLQERLVLPTPDGHRIEMIGLWGYDKYRARYRFAWLDEALALFDVMEGNWQDGRLVMDNARTGTTIVAQGVEYHGRMVWGPFEPDGFPVESQVSTDGGATWFTQTRGRYTRAD